MSATVLAYGGIGFLIWMVDDMVWPSTKEESCEHPERIGHKFCPVCGTKVATLVKEQGARESYVEAFEETNPNDKVYMAETVYYDQSHIGWGFGYGREEKGPRPPDNNGVFIGVGKEAGGYGEKVFKTISPIPPEAEIVETIRGWEQEAFAWLRENDLEPPQSLFDIPTKKNRFGLHVISYYN